MIWTPRKRLWKPKDRRGTLGLGCKCCGCTTCLVTKTGSAPCFWRAKLMDVAKPPCGCCHCEELNGRELLFQNASGNYPWTGNSCTWAAIPCPASPEYWACTSLSPEAVFFDLYKSGAEYFLQITIATPHDGTVVWLHNFGTERPDPEAMVGLRVPFFAQSNPWDDPACIALGSDCQQWKCDYNNSYWEITEKIDDPAFDPDQQLFCGTTFCPSCHTRIVPPNQCDLLKLWCPPQEPTWRHDAKTPTEIMVTLPAGWSQYMESFTGCGGAANQIPTQPQYCEDLDGVEVALQHASACLWVYVFPERPLPTYGVPECDFIFDWTIHKAIRLQISKPGPNPNIFRVTVTLTMGWRTHLGASSIGNQPIWQKDFDGNDCHRLDIEALVGEAVDYQSTGFFPRNNLTNDGPWLSPDCNFGQSDILTRLQRCATSQNASFWSAAKMNCAPDTPPATPYTGSPVTISGVVMP